MSTASGHECRLRWSGIQILSPDAGSTFNATTAGSIPVVARLTSASGNDGGGIAPGSMMAGTATLTRMQGQYSGTVSLSGTGMRSIGVSATFATGALDASVVVNVDTEAPTLEFFIPTPNYGATTADFIPSLSAGEFRKDEIVTVEVRSQAGDVDPSSISLTARANGATLQINSSVSCASAAFCRAFQLDLGQVELVGFSGPVSLSAAGRDLAGNMAQPATGSLNVTRWQWARSVGGGSPITGAMAVGRGGRLFVAVGAISGTLALDPDGGVAWGPRMDGPVVGPVVVGREALGASAAEWVFAQATTGGGPIRSYAAATGVAGNTCGGGGSVTNEGGVALLAEGTTDVGGVALQSIANNPSRLAANRVVGSACHTDADGGVSRLLAPGNLVATASVVALVGSNGNLRVFDVGLAFPQRPINQPVGGVGVNGLAWLSGTRLVGGGGGAGVGKLFAFDLTATTATPAWSAPTSYSTPFSGPAIRAGNELVAAMRSATDKVQIVRIGASDGVERARSAELNTSSATGSVVSTPLLGEGGLLYFVDENGTLFVMNQSFSPNTAELWRAALPSQVGTSVAAPISVDCNRRRATGGVLYLATSTGWVVSYLIDSVGLDSTSPWPKYARDARNSGNFDGSPIGCP
ncbi:MAG: hypothetical protein ACOZQL_04630 [Myxococcota bacterium]